MICFQKNNTFDPDEYFEDIVGVTFNKEDFCEKVILKFSQNRWEYINTKPLHGSQKIIDKSDESVTIELDLIVNKEFISLIFSFGVDVKVLEPEHLIETIKERAINTFRQYQ